MPKKNNSNLTKQYVHNHSTSASSSSTVSGSGGAGTSDSTSPRSVNERLEQLRREQSPRPNSSTFQYISAIATQPTVPPHLRHILAIPETSPVSPRTGLRAAARRTTPGPPAPLSWMDASRHTPRSRAYRNRASNSIKQGKDKMVVRERPTQFSMLARLPSAPNALPARNSLIHCCLKKMALQWEEIAEYEQNNLAALPVYLKSLLVSYLSVYAPDNALDIDGLKLLFLAEKDLPGSTGAVGLSQLDLTGYWNTHFTISDLTRYLYGSKHDRRMSAGLAALSIAQVENSAASTKPSPPSLATNSLPDSWEEASDSLESGIPGVISSSRFADLRRLSLANAGSFASWPQLLTLSQHLNAITHLSLAYWPLPTITPNSRQTFVESHHGRVSLGGTHIYSALDEDWHEAANILRRLSNNTYSLRWLDLEGCADWLSALTWGGSEAGPDRWADRTFRAGQPRVRFGDDHQLQQREQEFSLSSQSPSRPIHGPCWDDAWSQITYLNAAQGSLPRDVAALRRLPAGVVAAELLLFLRKLDDLKDDDTQRRITPVVELPAEIVPPVEVAQWLEVEKQARKVAAKIRAARTRSKGVYCKVDHGWDLDRLVVQ